MSAPNRPQQQPTRLTPLGGLGVVLFCAAVAVIATWDLALKLGTHLDRSTQDTMIHVWNSWWVRQALQRGQNPYLTDMLYYPGHVSLTTHNLAWFNISVGLLLTPLLGEIAAYNLSILLSLTLCGLTSFWLGYRLSGNPYAALVGAAVYQAWPFRISHLGHPNMIATMFIPLFVLALLNVVERQRWRESLWAGFGLALTGYVRWQQMIGAALVGGIVVLVALVRQPRAQRVRTLLLLALAGVVALVLLSPAVGMLLTLQSDPSQAAELLRADDAQFTQADLLSFLAPWNRQPLYGPPFDAAYERFYATQAKPMYPTYLGWPAMLLAAVALLRKPKAALPWLLAALALILLALGPTLRLNGATYPSLPTPYRLLEPLKVFQVMRFPRRYVMFLALPLSMLAVLGLGALPRLWRARRGWLRLLIALALCAVVVFDYLGTPMPLKAVDKSLSPGLDLLAEQDQAQAVLNVPMGYHWAKQYMFQQTVHGHPILQGSISRAPGDAGNLFEQLPAARLVTEDQESQPPPEELAAKLALLDEHGVAWLVLHLEELPEADVAAWRAAMPWAPFFEDELLLIYRTGE